MAKWMCTTCSYMHDGDGLPDECPMCGAVIEDFEQIED
jgi:rubrerythrin